eukprot:1161724-Rhodomonas_salina.1
MSDQARAPIVLPFRYAMSGTDTGSCPTSTLSPRHARSVPDIAIAPQTLDRRTLDLRTLEPRP